MLTQGAPIFAAIPAPQAALLAMVGSLGRLLRPDWNQCGSQATLQLTEVRGEASFTG